MKVYLLVLAASAIALFASSAHAKKSKADKSISENEGRVHIVWQSPDKYRDIRPSNQSRRSFRNSVFFHLDRKFEELSESLPSGHLMKLTVSDIDLAGEVFFGATAQARLNGRLGNGLGTGFGTGFGLAGNTDVRVIERSYIPRMNFSYSVVDENGAVVKEGEATLQDPGFLEIRITPFRNRAFVYEKQMIARWYKRNIEAEFTKI